MFPFYGLTPAMLRAMSNPATIQANIQATINATSRQQHRAEQDRQELGGEDRPGGGGAGRDGGRRVAASWQGPTCDAPLPSWQRVQPPTR